MPRSHCRRQSACCSDRKPNMSLTWFSKLRTSNRPWALTSAPCTTRVSASDATVALSSAKCLLFRSEAQHVSDLVLEVADKQPAMGLDFRAVHDARLGQRCHGRIVVGKVLAVPIGSPTCL